jgi:hypothetical protein
MEILFLTRRSPRAIGNNKSRAGSYEQQASQKSPTTQKSLEDTVLKIRDHYNSNRFHCQERSKLFLRPILTK